MHTFRWLFLEVLCHSFNFVNMRFVAKVEFFGIYFSLIISSRRFTFTKVYYIILLSLYLLLHMFPWMNKFLFTENNFLPPLMNRKVTGLCIVSSKVFMP